VRNARQKRRGEQDEEAQRSSEKHDEDEDSEKERKSRQGVEKLHPAHCIRDSEGGEITPNER